MNPVIDASEAFRNQSIETSPHKLSLALQGGAAHGAYTWGALDRLLDEPDISMTAVTGASSGAFNAVMLANGLAQGSRQLAKESLKAGWKGMSDAAGEVPSVALTGMSPFLPAKILTPFGVLRYEKLTGDYPNLSHALNDFYMKNYHTIHEYFPCIEGKNPIVDVTRNIVDFEAIRNSDFQVFMNAINGRTKKHHVFDNSNICAEAVGASANLRYMMPSVRMPDGDEYWDGGYRCNPFISPLAQLTNSTDIKTIFVSPLQEEEPSSGARAEQHLNSIVFSSGAHEDLMRIQTVNEMIDSLLKAFDGATKDGAEIDPEQMIERQTGKSIRHLHMLQKYVPPERGTSSKYNLEWEFLNELHDEGYEAEDRWLSENKASLGNASTFDPKAMYGAVYGPNNPETEISHETPAAEA